MVIELILIEQTFPLFCSAPTASQIQETHSSDSKTSRKKLKFILKLDRKLNGSSGSPLFPCITYSYVYIERERKKSLRKERSHDYCFFCLIS